MESKLREAKDAKGEWRTAVVLGVDFVPQEGELAAVVSFLTRTDGQRSGEVLTCSWEQFAALMERVGAKRASEVVGKACLVFCREQVVSVVEHLFAQNSVGE